MQEASDYICGLVLTEAVAVRGAGKEHAVVAIRRRSLLMQRGLFVIDAEPDRTGFSRTCERRRGRVVGRCQSESVSCRLPSGARASQLRVTGRSMDISTQAS
jgi:hypothetical protein